MDNRMIGSLNAQSLRLVHVLQIVKAYRHHTEIKLGGLQARREPEFAEDCRIAINACHDAERFLNGEIAKCQTLVGYLQCASGCTYPEGECAGACLRIGQRG